MIEIERIGRLRPIELTHWGFFSFAPVMFNPDDPDMTLVPPAGLGWLFNFAVIVQDAIDSFDLTPVDYIDEPQFAIRVCGKLRRPRTYTPPDS